MSATQDLRSCLLSLCEIIENILPNLQKGTISPELFRLAKQDDPEAVKPMTMLCYHLIAETFGAVDPNKRGLDHSKELFLYLDKLNISRPKSAKSSKALLFIFAILIHRLNSIDFAFYEAIDISKLLQSVAASSLSTTSQPMAVNCLNTHEQVLLIGKIRLMVSALKSWRAPKLPESVDYLSFEEFIIAQSDEKVAILDRKINSKLAIIKNYRIWNEKEEFFWGWIQQNFDSNLFETNSSRKNLQLHPEAKAQMARIEKMMGVFAKLPKPKFRPDRMKAQSQLTQALLGNMNDAHTGPPAGLAKMKQQKDSILESNVQKLSVLVQEEKSALVTFP